MKITKIKGRTFHQPGHSLNTDRIIPARFLTCVVFDDLGPEVFRDDREQMKGAHPFDLPENQGRSILVVDGDFGSGSSREHAPQALKHWGIKAIVGLSFADIFAGNSLAIGLPCVTMSEKDHAALVETMAKFPGEMEIDLERMKLLYQFDHQANSPLWDIQMPETHRQMLLAGKWDKVFTLLEAGPLIEEAAGRFPHMVPLPIAA